MDHHIELPEHLKPPSWANASIDIGRVAMNAPCPNAASTTMEHELHRVTAGRADRCVEDDDADSIEETAMKHLARSIMRIVRRKSD